MLSHRASWLCGVLLAAIAGAIAASAWFQAAGRRSSIELPGAVEATPADTERSNGDGPVSHGGTAQPSADVKRPDAQRVAKPSDGKRVRSHDAPGVGGQPDPIPTTAEARAARVVLSLDGLSASERDWVTENLAGYLRNAASRFPGLRPETLLELGGALARALLDARRGSLKLATSIMHPDVASPRDLHAERGAVDEHNAAVARRYQEVLRAFADRHLAHLDAAARRRFEELDPY